MEPTPTTEATPSTTPALTADDLVLPPSPASTLPAAPSAPPAPEAVTAEARPSHSGVAPLPVEAVMALFLRHKALAPETSVVMPRELALRLEETGLRYFDEQKVGAERATELGERLVAWRDVATNAVDVTKCLRRLRKCASIAEVQLELASLEKAIDGWETAYARELKNDDA